jgi:phage tail-like protein
MLGTSEARYLIEIDGITAIESSEASGLKKTHEEFELSVSNRPNPILGRGNFKVEALTIKHAHALNSVGEEYFEWFEGYIHGVNVEKRSARLIILEQNGDTPTAIYELIDCVPLTLEPQTHTAGGRNASYFNFSIRPEDMRLL